MTIEDASRVFLAGLVGAIEHGVDSETAYHGLLTAALNAAIRFEGSEASAAARFAHIAGDLRRCSVGLDPENTIKRNTDQFARCAGSA